MPEGIDVTGAVRLTSARPPCRKRSPRSQYRVATVDARGQAVPADVLGAAGSGRAGERRRCSVTRTRKGKESVDDIRPALRAIEVGHDGDVPVLDLTLSTQPRGARPREVLDALDRFTTVGVGLTEHRVLRTAQWIERDGARLEPLAADAFAPALEAQRIMREGIDVRRDAPGGDHTSGPTTRQRRSDPPLPTLPRTRPSIGPRPESRADG